MIIWSSSSWNLWKKCPAKYRIRKVERWLRPNLKEDTDFAKLSIPGLVVDRMLQFWLHRKRFNEQSWLTDNFEMVWSLVESEIHPLWKNDNEIGEVKAETLSGLFNAIRMLNEIELDKYHLRIQPSFFQ
jgi:hypothetical protein